MPVATRGPFRLRVMALPTTGPHNLGHCVAATSTPSRKAGLVVPLGVQEPELNWAEWPGARPTQTVWTGVAAACFLPGWSLGSPGLPLVPWPPNSPQAPGGLRTAGRGVLASS